MFRLIELFAILLLLVACSEPDVVLKIGNSQSPNRTLIGTLNTQVTLYRSASFSVTDTELTCFGASSDADYDTGWENEKVTFNILLNCDDGRSGKIIAKLSSEIGRENLKGMGVGKLNDGQKVVLAIGDLTLHNKIE